MFLCQNYLIETVVYLPNLEKKREHGVLSPWTNAESDPTSWASEGTDVLITEVITVPEALGSGEVLIAVSAQYEELSIKKWMRQGRN